MGARDFGDIDEIEAGIHVGREFAVEEIDEDAAGGSGLGVVGADGRGGVEDDDLLALLRSGDGLLLGEKLGALVVADHVLDRDRRVFIDDQAIGAEVHGGDAGGVDEALHAGFARHAQQFAGAVDVGAIHRLRVADPEAVIGGDVHDEHRIRQGRVY